jgi:hypothetical protein
MSIATSRTGGCMGSVYRAGVKMRRAWDAWSGAVVQAASIQ